jgi:predicted MFS family arabinose efflux permease
MSRTGPRARSRLSVQEKTQVLLAGLAALTVVGVLVVAVFDGPFPVVVGAALTVCGFAGGQAVLVGLAPELVATRDRDTAQGLLNFMIVLGGGIGPAAVAGLSGIVSVPLALAVLAALPLAGLVLSLTRRPGARHPPEPDDTRTEREPSQEKEPDCGRRAV